jgi:hypothetical protein
MSDLIERIRYICVKSGVSAAAMGEICHEVRQATTPPTQDTGMSTTSDPCDYAAQLSNQRALVNPQWPASWRVGQCADGSRCVSPTTGCRNDSCAKRIAIELKGDPPRCPKCGYSYEDCRTHMDHHLCGEPEPKP